MATKTLFQKVVQAEKNIIRDTEIEEHKRLTIIQVERKKFRNQVKEIIEESLEMQLVRESVERLQLRLELLRNIKMNLRGFQNNLTRKGMKMRINQHAHLEHLVSFLETGKGVVLEEDEIHLTSDPGKSLMTYEIQPTGAGKTGAFAIDIALMDVPSLTLVPFDHLLDQTKKDMLKIGGIPENQIGLVGGGTNEVGRKHTIATYAGHAAQMHKGGEYAQFMKTRCKFVICDEVHHQALGDRAQESIREIDDFDHETPTKEEQEIFKAEKDVISCLNQQTGVKSLKVAFTATPRGSKKHVRQYFPQCLGRVYYKEMVDVGLVVPYKIIQCDGAVFAGELEGYMSEDQEAEILEREGIYGKLAGEYAEILTAYRKTKHKKTDMPLRGMGFFSNHAECEKFVKEAEQQKLRCRIVTGREAKGRPGQAVINNAVDALLRNEIDLIVTVEKLATGFNREEINAIISGRITSAAKTIQYIGRGGRAFTDNIGRVKKDCLVFETNWTLKKNAKRGRKPMRLADALAYNAEDPQGICSMLNGTPLDIERIFNLERDGTIEIDGRQAIGINAYCRAMNPPMYFQTLQACIVNAKLQPVPKAHTARVIDIYWKDEVDALLPRRVNSKGIVRINDREAISISMYAKALEPSMGYATLCKRLELEKIQPVSGVKVISGSLDVDVYWKDEVDAVLENRLNFQGVISIEGREAIGINAYSEATDSLIRPPIRPPILKKYILEAGLQAISGKRVWGKCGLVDVYWKDAVDAIIRERRRT